VFSKFTQMAGVLSKLPQMKEEFAKFQAKAPTMIAEGEAGGGMVRVSVNGTFQMTQCHINEEAYRLQDREALASMVMSATNQALVRVRAMLSEEAQRVANEIGLPPGLGLPGLG
jgi:DNA-binding YbaB/EbfC family protein